MSANGQISYHQTYANCSHRKSNPLKLVHVVNHWELPLSLLDIVDSSVVQNAHVKLGKINSNTHRAEFDPRFLEQISK